MSATRCALATHFGHTRHAPTRVAAHRATLCTSNFRKQLNVTNCELSGHNSLHRLFWKLFPSQTASSPNWRWPLLFRFAKAARRPAAANAGAQPFGSPPFSHASKLAKVAAEESRQKRRWLSFSGDKVTRFELDSSRSGKRDTHTFEGRAKVI